MSSITITVPLDYFALTRASDMLHGMALDLENQGKQQARRQDDKPAGEHPTRTDAEAAFAPQLRPAVGQPDYTEEEQQYAETEAEKDAAAVFGGAPGKSPSPSMFAETAEGPGTAPPAETTPHPAATAEAPATAPSATEQAAPNTDPNGTGGPAQGAASPGTAPADTPAAPAGVDLDSDGLPWDSRIHSGSKGKLKKTQQWKPKRGVDPELKAEVEAELKAAMSASPANPVTPTETTEPAPAKPAAPAAEPAAQTPAPPPSQQHADPTGVITTFPALMQRITAGGIPQATVTAAVNKQGLRALPLLTARPDLIPAVAAELFPGG